MFAFVIAWGPTCCFCAFCQIGSKALASLKLSSILLCVLFAPTLHPQHSTHSLVASSMFSRVITSLNSFSVITSLFNLPMNCSFKNLKLSYFCLQSAQTILGRVIAFTMQILVLQYKYGMVMAWFKSIA